MINNKWLKIAILLICSFIVVMSGTDAFAQNSKKKLAKPLSGVNYDRACYIIVESGGIEGLIERHYNVNCKLPAEDNDDGSIVEMPNDFGEISIQNNRKNIVTPLFYAYDPEEFEMLIKAGAKVNAKDSNGQTVLYDLGIFKGDFDENVLDILIKSKINVNSKDKAGLTALENAIPALLTNAFGWIEDGQLSGDDFKDNEGCGYTKSFEQVYTYMKKLIAAGAKLKSNKYSAKTLLEMEPEQFVKALLSSVNLNAKDIHGQTILHKVMITQIHDMPFAKSFIDECIKKNQIPRDISSGQLYDPIKALIDAGADVNVKDSKGKTAIFYVRNPHVAEALIDAKAKMNITDNDGNTPLIWIVKNGGVSDISGIVNKFIAAGADIKAKDKSGKTAADYAEDDSLKKLLSE